MSEEYNPLEHIMDIKQAETKWKLSNSTIKNMCIYGKVKAIRMGTTWVLDKDQPNPKLK